MKVYFLDSYDNKRELAEVQTKEEVWSVINNFLKERNYKSYYTRMWYEDKMTWVDVGSHSEFFLVDENIADVVFNSVG